MVVRKVLYCLTVLATLACSHAQCDNVLLPNVGNLSQCLDRRLGECSTNSEMLEEDLTQFFKCMFDELPRATDPAATLFNLVDLYQAVLSELELPVNVTPVATLLCYRLNFSLEACAQPALSRDVRCGSLLSVFFPSSFAVRQCTDRSALICFEDEQPQMRTLKALFGMLTCVFEGAPADVRPQLALSLACPLVQLLRQALEQFTQVITWPILAEQVRNSVEQLTILLLHLASCEDDMDTMPSVNGTSTAVASPSLPPSSNSATSTTMPTNSASYTSILSTSTSRNNKIMTSGSIETGTNFNATTVESDSTYTTNLFSPLTTNISSQSSNTPTLSGTPTRTTSPTQSANFETMTSFVTATSSHRESLSTTNETTTVTGSGPVNSTLRQETSTSFANTNATTLAALTTRTLSSSAEPDEDTVSGSSSISNAGITTENAETSMNSTSENSTFSTMSDVTTNTPAVVSINLTTVSNFTAESSNSVTVRNSSSAFSDNTTTASPGMSLQTVSYVTTLSSVASSLPSSASGQTSTLGPSSAPAEDEDPNTPANVSTSTISAPNQTAGSISEASLTQIQDFTITTSSSTSSPGTSSVTDRTIATSPSNTDPSFTTMSSSASRVMDDSSNVTTSEDIVTQGTMTTSVGVPDVNSTSDDATTQTFVMQNSTTNISASATTVRQQDLTAESTDERTEPRNSNTSMRMTTVASTTNVSANITVSAPSDSTMVTSPTRGQGSGFSTITANSSSADVAPGDTSFGTTSTTSSNVFSLGTSGTVPGENPFANSTTIMASTAGRTITTTFTTTSSVIATGNLSTTVSVTQGSNETPVVTSSSTTVASADSMIESLPSCVNVTLPNLFGLDTCTIRVLSTSMSLQCVLDAAKDLIIAAFTRFSSDALSFVIL
ncbi:hypothetical protein MRX96_014764 [Rhipicephalus microplus]